LANSLLYQIDERLAARGRGSLGGQPGIVGSGGRRTGVSSEQTVISSGCGLGGRVLIDGDPVGTISAMIPTTCPGSGYAMLFSEEVLNLCRASCKAAEPSVIMCA